MRESRTFGSVGGEGGNVLAYPAYSFRRGDLVVTAAQDPNPSSDDSSDCCSPLESPLACAATCHHLYFASGSQQQEATGRIEGDGPIFSYRMQRYCHDG